MACRWAACRPGLLLKCREEQRGGWGPAAAVWSVTATAAAAAACPQVLCIN